MSSKIVVHLVTAPTPPFTDDVVSVRVAQMFIRSTSMHVMENGDLELFLRDTDGVTKVGHWKSAEWGSVMALNAVDATAFQDQKDAERAKASKR